ncbi:MAG: phosphate transport regulator [Burkholderiales bacterium]|nr:MAG: phosphate transport regulator [Burkholderiales bacterium]
MEKAAAVAAMGQECLLLPAWMKAALAANDRLKLMLSMMQAIDQGLASGQQAPMDWRRELGRLGLQDVAWLQTLGQGAYRQDGILFVPHLEEWINALERDLHVMARPVCERPGHEEPRLLARRNTWAARLEALKEEEGLYASALQELTHGDRHAGDSLHLLVMDLHKAINGMSAYVATEDIDGAHVWQISPQDRDRVRAFMRGIHATASLKFGHPGLDTAVTRDGDRLLIQNDIGTNDAHVLVIEWWPGALHLNYSDLHANRFAFFGRMMQGLGFRWEALDPRVDTTLNRGKPYQLGHASLESEDERRLLEALEMAASRIVFVIDWNRARKRLQAFVRKPVAIDLLEQAARDNVGHMAWLLAGGEQLVYGAMQAVDGDAFRVGDRLDQVLGESASRAYLLDLMRAASVRLREQQPAALVGDEARMLLARAIRKRTFEFDLLAEHSAYCHALALSLVEGLMDEEDPAAAQARLVRAKAWERQADHVLSEARGRAERQARWQPLLMLLDRLDDVADVLEESLYVLSLLALPQLPRLPRAVKHGMLSIAETTLGAIQDQVRAVEIARHLDENVPQLEGDAFLQALWRILRAERVCDESLREARMEIVKQLHNQPAAMQLAGELAQTIEQATDHLLGAAYALRKLVFEKSGVLA